jgi:LuxR family maltose regulon positive regulatory protein
MAATTLTLTTPTGVPPAPADGLVRRPRLSTLLGGPDAPPLALLVAPAGYGKTTLLREWAARDVRAFAWVTLDPRDNEPARLLRSITGAIDAARPARSGTPFVLVLDDAHVLDAPAARHLLTAMADELPPGASIAIASRREPALPVARLRAQRMIVELGPRELALTRTEAAALFRHNGVQVDAESVNALLRRTEGWPVALSLAALCLGECPTAGAIARFGSRDRIVADYIRDELLAELSPQHRSFARRTSVLDVLSGPLCDAVLEQSGSAAVLAELARGGALIVPLDRNGEQFRHHRLMSETLRAELRRAEPGREQQLHRRASAWHREAGDIDRALHHGLAAGDVRGAAELVWTNAGPCFTHGRNAELDRWLGRFDGDQVMRDPVLCLAVAGRHLARGDGHLVEHWAALAAAAPPSQRVAAGALAALRAALARNVMARMLEDADAAAALIPEGSPWRAVCSLLAGVALQLAGRRADAVIRLEDGARRAAVAAPNVHALCLTQLAVAALETGDWEDAAELVARARAQVDRHALGDDATMTVVFAVSAVVRGHRGRIEEAGADAAHALERQRRLTDFAPWYEIELLVMLARSALRLGDVNLTRELLVQAGRLEHQAPGAPLLQTWLQDAWRGLHAFTAAGPAHGAAPALTSAELRILGFLPTHLSFREIAERTYVSPNTVKTQANSVYRKLDVSCRSDAVAQARVLGLLDT